MRVLNPFLIIILVIVLDIYVYQGLRSIFKSQKKSAKSFFSWAYWLISMGLLAGVLIAMNSYQKHPDDLTVFNQIMNFNGVFLISLVFKLMFAIFKIISDIYLR